MRDGSEQLLPLQRLIVNRILGGALGAPFYPPLIKIDMTTDKSYRLLRGRAPLSFMIPGRSTNRKPLLYWDEEKGENRVLRYARNQRTPFEDEQDGNAIVEPIIFEDGMLHVPKTNPVLQQFLDRHPMNGAQFEELNLERDAEAEVEQLNMEVDALIECKALTIDQLETMARLMLGINPSKYTTAELRRDMLIAVRREPEHFLTLANDPDLKLQGKILQFFSENLLSYRRNKTEIWFNGPENKKKLLTVPHGQDSVVLATSYLLSDEGLEHLRILDTLVS